MRLSVGGRTVLASRTGSRGGRPLVLVHGAGLDHTVWTVVGRLWARDGFHVLAVDLPGHGGSDGPACASIGEAAAWLADAIAAMALDRPVLVGHSMGALIALDAAATLGDAAGGLVLTGAAEAMPVNPKLLDMARTAPPRAAELIARWGFRAGRPVGRTQGPTPLGRAFASRLIAAADDDVLIRDLAACDAYKDAPARAAALARPALVIAGRDDVMTPVAGARALAAAMPDATLVEVNGCGHMAMLEAPRQVCIAAARFVAGLA